MFPTRINLIRFFQRSTVHYPVHVLQVARERFKVKKIIKGKIADFAKSYKQNIKGL